MAKTIDMVVLNDGDTWSEIKGSYIILDYECDIDDTQIGVKIDLETIVNDYILRHRTQYSHLKRNKETA